MLRLLGQPRHCGTGTFPARGYEIAAFVGLAAGQGVDRTFLATLLWPDSADPHVNLRYVLHAIRQWSAANTIAVFEIAPAEIRKLRQPTSDLDLLAGATVPKSAAELSTYVNSFGRELLEGHVTASADFESWLGEQRSRLQQVFVDTVLDAAAALTGPVVDAALLRAEARSPFDDRIILARVKNLVSYRRRAAAVAAYQAFRARYLSELGVDLDARVRQAVGLTLPETLAPEDAICLAAGTVTVPPSVSGVPSPGLPTVLILPPALEPGLVAAQVRFLSRALISEVTMLLGRMRTFAMFAPYTARQLFHDDPLTAARAVGAAYVVSTEIMDGGAGQQLGFSLIHTASQAILVADTVALVTEGEGQGDERLATAIAAAVANHIAAVEVRRFRRTGEASTFTHYLLGQERLSYDLKSIRKARSHFRRAATLSPKFAPAHAMIARSLTYEWLVLGRQDPCLLHEALQLAALAIEIDPLLPSGPWELGHALLYLQRLDESREQLERALERSPHVADLLADHADVFVHLGDGPAAKAAITKAMALNPLSPDEYHWVLGASDFLLENYKATLESFHRMANTRPVARLMAACYAMLGDLETAGHHRDRWLEDYPDFKVQDWVRVVPMRDRGVSQQIVEAMRTAGFQ